MRKEERKREMRQRIQEIEGNITSVSASIRQLEEEMALEDIFVLHVRKHLKDEHEHWNLSYLSELQCVAFQKCKGTLPR